jgi:alkanesulfonate monooxygenase SsuD/methylene tetrahydromethanopterin reductase-like flavin-dependent oxidoreductase (luciferase family)
MRFAYFSHVWGRPGSTPAQRFAELWDEVQTAEEAGFDYAFSVEHHFTPQESWMPSPAVFCTGVAARTSRIRVGPMGYVPALHHPLRLAEEVATLDQILDGRLEVGLASGVTRDFFDPFDADFERRKELTFEAAELIRASAGADGPIEFSGQTRRISGPALSFGTVQRPHPPLWVPTTNRATLRRLAALGAHTSTTMLLPRAVLGTVYRHYVDWWFDAGHAGVPNIGYWTIVYVAETDQQAIDHAMPQIVHTLTKTLGYGSAGNPRDRASTVGRSGLSTADILEHADDVEFLLKHRLVFVGSPETVAGQIRSAAEEGCFNTLMGEFNFGRLTADEVRRSTELFGREVIPALRDFEPYRRPAADGVYTDDESAQVAERLEALGYIE